MIKNAIKLLISPILLGCINLFGGENQNISLLAKGSRQMAENVIASAKLTYRTNHLMNAIVRRNITGVTQSLEYGRYQQNRDTVYQFTIESVDLGTILFDGELQDKMLSSQTGLSLALLNSSFDSTPEEKNNSLSIIKLLLEAGFTNMPLANSYLIKDKAGCIRIFEEDVNVVSWMIRCGCSEEAFKLVLDYGFLSNIDSSAYTLYRELAEGSGYLNLAKLIDEYSQNQPQPLSPKRLSGRKNQQKIYLFKNTQPKSSKDKALSLFFALFEVCLTKNTVFRNNINSSF